MERREQHALIALLVEGLRSNGSWGGETHVQKAMYFVEHLTNFSVGFDFLMYKHGPFSFDLRGEITAMQADLLLEREYPRPDYGPSLKVTQNMKGFFRRYQDSLQRVRPVIQFVAEHFGDRDVAQLERLGTALYVLRKYEDEGDPGKLAQRIVDLKPHVELSQAQEAVKTVLEWQEEAERLGLRAA